MSKMSDLLIDLEYEGIDITDDEAVIKYISMNKQMRGNKMTNKETKRTTYYEKDSREAVLDRVHRQRAIKAGAAWEKIDLKQFFSKQVNCAICSKPMNFTTGNSDPDYVTVDHIIAFANGGTHTTDNIQLVHRKCNGKKGTK